MVLKVRMILLLMVMSLVGYSQPLIYNSSQISYDGKLVVLPPFSPLDYTPIAWYDSQDLATITKDGSNYVSQWGNKASTGSTYNLNQVTGANQPLYSATNGIVFDGSNDYIYKILPITYNEPNTCFIVGSFDFVTPNVTTCFMHGVYQYNNYMWFGDFNYAKTMPTSVFIGTYKTTNTTTDYIYDNNNLVATGNVIVPYNISQITLGANNLFTGKLNGKIKEVIIYNSDLTTEQIGIVNAYLNTKYSIY